VCMFVVYGLYVLGFIALYRAAFSATCVLLSSHVTNKDDDDLSRIGKGDGHKSPPPSKMRKFVRNCDILAVFGRMSNIIY